MNDQDEYTLDLLTRYAAAFLRQAKKTRRRTTKERVIEISLKQFDNSPLVLYAVLSYAGRHGITIIVPPSDRAD